MDYRQVMSRHGVSWQAHRGGGGHERPDNTLASARYGWDLGGIPELDVRRTADGVMVCLHDATLARTTTAPAGLRGVPLSGLTLDQIKPWDAGAPFDPCYAGERVPTLAELFAELAGRPERSVYLDLKDVDLPDLARLIATHGVGGQLIVCSPLASQCQALRALGEGLRTMLWLGGSRECILDAFATCGRQGFAGLDQVQFHLNDAAGAPEWPWQITRADLAAALAVCQLAQVDLEVLPWHFATAGIHALLDLGIRWFATDEPRRFAEAVAGWGVTGPAPGGGVVGAFG